MSDLADRAQLEAVVGKKLAPIAQAHLEELKKLYGDPPDFNKIPEEYWKKIQKDADNALAVVLIAIFLQSLDNEDWDLDDDAEDDAVDWANRRAHQISKLYRQNTSKRVRELLKEREQKEDAGEFDDEEDEFEGRIDNVFGQNRIDVMASVEVTTGHTAALEYMKRKTGGQLIWRCEEGACDDCEPLDGEPESVWRDVYPQGPPEPHCNCLLPGNRIGLPGRLTGATQSFYDGPGVEIILANGCRCTVTTNHQVLSARGWVAAQFIRQGDDVFSGPHAERDFLGLDPHNHQRPALVEQVVAALGVAPQMRTVAVPVTAVDFHGDERFGHGDVNVVRPVRFLSRHRQSTLYQPGRELQLVMRAGVHSPFFGGGLSRQLRGADGSTAGRRMGRCRQCGAIFWRQGGHPQRVRRRDAAHGDAAVRQMGVNRFAADAPLPRQRVRRLPSQIAADQFVRAFELEGRTPAAFGNAQDRPMQQQVVAQDRLADASFPAEFLQGRAGVVAPSQVLRVRQFHYVGHVYNLQVEPYHVYTSGGIVVKNCRCWLDLVVPPRTRNRR